MTFEEVLQSLHTTLATKLLQAVESGQADASTLNCARQFLKDNGIQGTPESSPEMLKLVDSLPFNAEAA